MTIIPVEKMYSLPSVITVFEAVNANIKNMSKPPDFIYFY